MTRKMHVAVLVAALTSALVVAQQIPIASKPFRMGKRTLVLTAGPDDSRYFMFLRAFESRGHTLTHRSVGDTVPVDSYGEFLYDNIILLASGASSFGGLSSAALTAFVDAGGNLFAAGDSNASAAFRLLASEFGVDFDAAGSKVIDHFSHDTLGDGGKHTRVLSSQFHPSPHVVGVRVASGGGGTPVVYEGTGMVVRPENILAMKVLTASSTGYSAGVEAFGEYPQSAGTETVLVASVQARNNARATFTGSTWMLSDEAFQANVQAPSGAGGVTTPTSTANEAFAAGVGAWTFQEAGVLRAWPPRHRKQDGSEAERQVEEHPKPDLPLSMFPQPEIARSSRQYRINDDIEYLLSVEVFDGATQTWVPYIATDLQLEFVMLDPYVRVPLQGGGLPGQYVSRFKVPDVYGIFHFRVQYRRPGLTVLTLKDQVNVRPFRHDEYERFIVAAYPYYAAAFVMMAGVFGFSIFFVFAPSTSKAVKSHTE